jgi:hypothetical protein
MKESEMTTETKNRWQWRLGLRGGLVVLGIVSLGSVLPGCFVDSSPPPASSCGDAQLQASWSITGGGGPISCTQAGASEVDLIVDAMEVPVSCDAHFGATPFFAPGTRTVTLELRDSGQNVLSRLGPMTERFACDDVINLGEVVFPL